MRKGLTLAQIDELEAQEKARKQAEKEAKRVAAQQKRKEEAKLRAAAKKVAQEMAKKPDPKPEPQVTAPRAASPALQQAVEEAFSLPYEPPSYNFGPNDDPYSELAQRELCRRKLLPFIQRFRPKYSAGWVHEDICRRLERFVEQVEQGLSPRLLLMMPVRHGKSEICSRHFPPWVFGKHPDWEIIAASGAQSLALSFSRYARDLLQDPAYGAVFPETQLDPSSKSVENWNLTKGGGYLSAGIGTMITGRGANCFPAGTRLCTSSGYVRIEHVQINDKVLSYDHETNKIVESVVEATQVTSREELVEVTFRSGRRFVCTEEHPVYVVGRGYVEAQVLERGSRVLRCGVSSVPGQEISSIKAVQRVLLQGSQSVRGFGLQLLRKVVSKTTLRLQEIAKTRIQGPLLFASMFGSASRDKERKEVSCLRQSRYSEWASKGGDLLLRGLSKIGFAGAFGEGAVPCVHNGVSTELSSGTTLLQRVCGFGAQSKHDWKWESKLQGWEELRQALRGASRSYTGARRAQVCDMRRDDELGCAPHRPHPVAQHVEKPDNAVSQLPRGLPQDAIDDVVDSVQKIRQGSVEVYDIQVKGTRNFFAEQILVHNCLIIDDPVKDGEAADSPTIRESVWEWYMSTAYTRLAPGGGVLGVLTWWNEDDWAGRIQQVMKTGDGDVFEIIRYPAINDQGDEYILPDDTMEQFPPGSPPPPEGSKLTRPMGSALHEARYPVHELLKKKSNYMALGQKRWWDALFQQNPIPDDGNYFTKDMFRYYGTAPARNELYVYQAWDFAISTGKESDYTVGTCIGVDHRENVYVLDVMRFRSGDGGHIIDSILDFAEAHNADCLGFEDGQIWKAIEFQFQKRCEERRQYPSHEVLKPLTDKMVRASPLRGRMQLGKVYFDKHAPWFDPVYKELVTFPAGKHDDAVDSLAWAVRLTLSRAAPRAIETRPKLKSWKDRLSGGARGGSHMAA